MNVFFILQLKNNQNNTVDDDNYSDIDRNIDYNVKNRSGKFYFFSNHNISRGGEGRMRITYQMIFMLPLSFMSRRSLSLTLALYLSPFVCLSHSITLILSLISYLSLFLTLSLSLSLSLSYSLLLSLLISLSVCLALSLFFISLSSSLSQFLFLSCLLTSIFHRIPSISWLQRQGPIVQYSF